jgi:hypothetical protein
VWLKASSVNPNQLSEMITPRTAMAEWGSRSMFGDTIFSLFFETLSGPCVSKSQAHVPILRDPPMISLCDGLNGEGVEFELAGDFSNDQ